MTPSTLQSHRALRGRGRTDFHPCPRPQGFRGPVDSSGLTLVEVLIALIVLALGVLGLAKIMPVGTRSEVAARMQTTACQYANETFESTRGLAKTASGLSLGRHPASGFDTLGTSKAWKRYYVVTQMAAPLDSLYKVDVAVLWKSTKPESIRVTSYMVP
jgi:type IV pilus modification protein PilV